ncbi:MAG: hypothetical protein MUE85_08050 [Microscillaceae bacterium]|nr:hypothetical protein [Microscillaceae bacterium]
MWQNQDSSPQKSPITQEKNSKIMLLKVQKLQKRWRIAGIGGSLGLAFTILVLLIEVALGRDESWFNISGNLLIISGLAWGIYLIWQYNYFTVKRFGEPTLAFLEQKIQDIELRTKFIAYFIFFVESGLTLGLNFKWWENFSLYDWHERILAHSTMSIGTIVVFEIIKSIALEKYEQDAKPVLTELQEARNRLKNE